MCIYHILGFHIKCSDFCKKRPSYQTKNDNENNEEPTDSFDDFFYYQSQYWKLQSEEELQISRCPDKNKCNISELKELIVMCKLFSIE